MNSKLLLTGALLAIDILHIDPKKADEPIKFPIMEKVTIWNQSIYGIKR